jgi:hypothetical protein
MLVAVVVVVTLRELGQVLAETVVVAQVVPVVVYQVQRVRLTPVVEGVAVDQDQLPWRVQVVPVSSSLSTQTLIRSRLVQGSPQQQQPVRC